MAMRKGATEKKRFLTDKNKRVPFDIITPHLENLFFSKNMSQRFILKILNSLTTLKGLFFTIFSIGQFYFRKNNENCTGICQSVATPVFFTYIALQISCTHIERMHFITVNIIV